MDYIIHKHLFSLLPTILAVLLLISCQASRSPLIQSDKTESLIDVVQEEKKPERLTDVVHEEEKPVIVAETTEDRDYNVDSSAKTCGNDIGNGNEIISGPSGPLGQDYDQAFRSLTVHPTNSNIILIGTERNGVLRSTDGGHTWSRHRAGFRHTDSGYPEIWDIAISPSNPSIVIAATLDSPGPVTGDYPSSIGGVYKSIDGGQTWTRKNCGLSNSRITSVQFDAVDSNIAVIGVEGGSSSFSQLQGKYFDGGIFKTTNGGENWERITISTLDNKNGFWKIEARGSNPTTFITFGMNYYDISENLGFFRSADSGSKWSFFGEEISNLKITSFGVSSDGNIIYANERDSYEMKKSMDGGKTWATTSTNDANGPIAISPKNPEIILYAGSSSLYRSSDDMATYTEIIKSESAFNDITFAPSDSNIVYAITRGYLLYKSTDAGASFIQIKNIRADVLNGSF